jgi:hypothetical protein
VALALLGGEITFDLDPEKVAAAIASRILEAETVEDAFTMGGATPWQDRIGIPVTVLQVHFNQGRFDAGPGAYAVVRAAELNSGEIRTLTCGSVNVMAQLIKAELEGALPIKCRLIQAAQQTAQGFFPLWLEGVKE